MDPLRLVYLVQSVATLISIWRLVGLKLGRRFPALVAWLLVQGASPAAAALFGDGSAAYFWSYFLLVPLQCIFDVIAVRELFSLVFADYPGMRTAGRWSMYAGIAIAIAGSGAMLGIFRRTSTHGSLHLFYLVVLQRSVVFSLAIVIVTILFFLSRYPLHLGRNTYISSSFFSALFLSDAVRFLIDSLQIFLHSDAADWAEGAFTIVCLITWAYLLEPNAPPKQARVAFSSPEEDHLLEQLASLNQLLGRTVRR